jgi:uncharacterized damage-inducible protein DinB
MQSNCFASPEEMLKHWQGHRKLTRRVIEAFPEEAFSTFSVGGMRPFSLLAEEMIDMAAPGIRGFVTGDWQHAGLSDEMDGLPANHTKAGVLQRWDAVTAAIDEGWAQIPEERFHAVVVAFGQYEQPVYATIFYFIDNEIHHRGQGYVYLRALGIEPPPFWDRPM